MTEPPSTPPASGRAPGRKERVAPVGFADARPRRRPSLAARRFGYLVAAAANVVLVIVIQVSPGWSAAPFLTDAAADVIPLLTLSLAAGIVANVVWFLTDPLWLRSLGDMITAAISVVLLGRVLALFPFTFDDGSTLRTVFRLVLVVALVGTAIAVVAHLVAIIRHLAQPQPQPQPQPEA